jgi:hypothetical protein
MTLMLDADAMRCLMPRCDDADAAMLMMRRFDDARC